VIWGPESIYGTNCRLELPPVNSVFRGFRLQARDTPMLHEPLTHVPVPEDVIALAMDQTIPYRALEKVSDELALPQVDVSFEDVPLTRALRALALLSPNPFMTLDVRSRYASIGILSETYDITCRRDLTRVLEELEQALAYPDALLALSTLLKRSTNIPSFELGDGPDLLFTDSLALKVVNHEKFFVVKNPYLVAIRRQDGLEIHNTTSAVIRGAVPPAVLAEDLPGLAAPMDLLTMSACPVLAEKAASAVRGSCFYTPYGTPCLEREGATLTTTGAKAGCFIACPHLDECPYSGRTTPVTPGVYNLSVWSKIAEMAGLPVKVEGMRVRFRDLTREEYILELRPWKKSVDVMRIAVNTATVTGMPTHLAIATLQLATLLHVEHRFPGPVRETIGKAILPLAAFAAGRDPSVLEGLYPLPEVMKAMTCWPPDMLRRHLVLFLSRHTLPPEYRVAIESILCDGSGSIVNGTI